uniref:Uncharacterized protein n=1 Tax=Trichuris muris TaxID=70415 RepID=A0A5S6QEJ3_TRIMR
MEQEAWATFATSEQRSRELLRRGFFVTLYIYAGVLAEAAGSWISGLCTLFVGPQWWSLSSRRPAQSAAFTFVDFNAFLSRREGHRAERRCIKSEASSSTQTPKDELQEERAVNLAKRRYD